MPRRFARLRSRRVLVSTGATAGWGMRAAQSSMLIRGRGRTLDGAVGADCVPWELDQLHQPLPVACGLLLVGLVFKLRRVRGELRAPSANHLRDRIGAAAQTVGARTIGTEHLADIGGKPRRRAVAVR